MKKALTKVMAMALAFILLFGSAATGIGGIADVFDTISVRASAATIDDISYRVVDGEAYISECSEDIAGKIVIPETIDGYPVTGIDVGVFNERKGLTGITIPASVKTIGPDAVTGCTKIKTAGPIGGGYDYEFGWTDTIPDFAFQSLTELKSVKLPESITKIGKNAFMYCACLTDIDIPDSVSTIGEMAFAGCSSLKSVKLPNSLTEINYGLFADCFVLKDVTIPEGVTDIGDSAFILCSIKSLVLPKSVKSIGKNAVSGLHLLTELYGVTEKEMVELYKSMYETAIENGEDNVNGVPIRIWKNIIDDVDFSGKLTDVYYEGSKDDKEMLSIGEPNDDLLNATWHYAEIRLENAKIDVKSDEVYKNSIVTVTATAENVPEGYYLAVYDSGSEPVAKGDNKTVKYEIPGKVASDKTLTVKVVDANNNTQKDGNGKDLTAEINIKVKTGFFEILIAFFRMIFGMNKVTIKP